MSRAPLTIYLQSGLTISLRIHVCGVAADGPMILCSVSATGGVTTVLAGGSINSCAAEHSHKPLLNIGMCVIHLDSVEQAQAAQAWIDHFRATVGLPERIELEVPA